MLAMEFAGETATDVPPKTPCQKKNDRRQKAATAKTVAQKAVDHTGVEQPNFIESELMERVHEVVEAKVQQYMTKLRLEVIECVDHRVQKCLIHHEVPLLQGRLDGVEETILSQMEQLNASNDHQKELKRHSRTWGAGWTAQWTWWLT